VTRTRTQGRAPDQFRPLRFTRAFTSSAPGSVLVEAGDTKILCTVTLTDKTPIWMPNGSGAWLTAEYSMLPGSTSSRKPREGRSGRVDGRSQEIQRLIGRSLRGIVDLKSMPDMTIWVDCDVLSADGGTRTTAINGACVALYDALLSLEEKKTIRKWPMRNMVSAISVGLLEGQSLVDLDYPEDNDAEVDMNVVCTSDGRFVEIQSTAEGHPFERERFDQLLDLAKEACGQIHAQQKQVLGLE
jgi:ribonuclease PH